ncbi:MAG: hypothetical protein A3H01_00235 [Candidatus Wildermuthbacteria bacterium RIFCSPLOWO2_12_FULL_40_9]|uniref:Phospho-N-acetylmuramoyl-pentapeptide-transferase n=2 Tax=Candidatus Wildermuthiibacteriota TaxID=1817923 RepID=A0A1G2RC66_9BACT|nr:MAG: hypothetical protein A3F15_02725 [Candidatus Wildermuthbacteria bacterium RIFCSPHIGHO2_12_FULL_40_12]OHA76516.1 MAG: hypothetical protein A3H01_00235 [Candidatus Wildermuthbacteria bacterium RIFCSPLOWO2_12_FULL_40_9]
MTLFNFNLIKIFSLFAFAAILAMILAPSMINFLYKIKFWKKEARKKTITGEDASVVYALHKDREVAVPRGGGLIIWISVLVIALFLLLLSFGDKYWWLKRINFLSRSETWLPFFTLIAASLVGLLDDFLQVFGRGRYVGGGMTFTRRLIIVALIGLIGGWWFYFKLNWDSIHIPLILNFPGGIDLSIGFWYIPLFVIVMLASWAGGVIDGLDGLAGGIFATIFSAFTVIAFAQDKIELASLCAVISGTLFAFLWFNIPPARFYMGETGILGLTSTMAVVAFLTDSIAVLPIIGGLLVIEVGSIIIQLASKKFFRKKIFLATPIHHHFEAKGWTPHEITMRFWLVGVVLAIIGVAIRLL